MKINDIYPGDSLELLKQLPADSIDLVITSPPYSTLKRYIDNPGVPADKYVDWFLPYCAEICRVIKPTGSFILNINDKVEGGFRHPYVFDLISEIHKKTELKMFERLFWNKMKGLPHRSRFGDRVEYLFWFAKAEGFKFNIDQMRTPYAEKSIQRMKKPLKKRFARTENEPDEYKDWAPHPLGALPSTLINISSQSKRISDTHVAVFPMELVEYFIGGSTDQGDLVLDPFMGTGTTGVSCKKLNRNYLGFELEPQYIVEAKKRILNYVKSN